MDFKQGPAHNPQIDFLLLEGPWTFHNKHFLAENKHKGKRLNGRCITLLLFVEENVGCTLCVDG